MIDFCLTEEQRALRESTRRFARDVIRPASIHLDAAEDPDAAFSASLVNQGLDLGFGNVLVPEVYGGYGGNLLDYALVIEELAYGDSGIADLFLVNISLSNLINQVGSEPQREKYLSDMTMSGRHFILAGAMTEPSGGSELFYPLGEKKFGVRTKAVREGSEYVLNGGKCFITNGGRADVYIVLARTDSEGPNLSGCSLFLVPKDMPGVGVGKVENKMGHRLSSVREIMFDQVRIPIEQRLGGDGEGFACLLKCYAGNGVGVGASAIGVARAAYEIALEVAQSRVSWGVPIIQHESVASKLVEMRMKIEAARSLVWRLAWAADHPDQSEGLHRLVSMAKVFPSAMVREVVAAAMDVCGGMGYMRDFPIEKLMRDAMLYPIYDGTNDLLKRFLASDLAGT